MGKWVMSIINSTGYAGIVMLMFIENVFPPIPSEFIMPLAGFMVKRGEFSLVGVIAAGVAGSVLGALPLYYLGKKIGEERLKELADKHGRWLTVSRGDIERAKRWFDRHGGAAVLFCRLIPGVRSLISIPAGIDKMNLAPFLIYTTLGSIVWTGFLAGLGFFLSSNFRQVEEYLDPISYAVLAIIAVGYAVRVVRHKK